MRHQETCAQIIEKREEEPQHGRKSRASGEDTEDSSGRGECGTAGNKTRARERTLDGQNSKNERSSDHRIYKYAGQVHRSWSAKIRARIYLSLSLTSRSHHVQTSARSRAETLHVSMGKTPQNAKTFSWRDHSFISNITTVVFTMRYWETPSLNGNQRICSENVYAHWLVILINRTISEMKSLLFDWSDPPMIPWCITRIISSNVKVFEDNKQTRDYMTALLELVAIIIIKSGLKLTTRSYNFSHTFPTIFVLCLDVFPNIFNVRRTDCTKC